MTLGRYKIATLTVIFCAKILRLQEFFQTLQCVGNELLIKNTVSGQKLKQWEGGVILEIIDKRTLNTLLVLHLPKSHITHSYIKYSRTVTGYCAHQIVMDAN